MNNFSFVCLVRSSGNAINLPGKLKIVKKKWPSNLIITPIMTNNKIIFISGSLKKHETLLLLT